jgi:transposase
MGNVLSDSKKQEILALGRLGWSLHGIEKTTGVRRETVARYLRAANIVVRPPRHQKLPNPASQMIVDSGDNPKAASQVITDSATRQHQVSGCEAHHEFIKRNLALGRNVVAIWQELVSDYGFTQRYASVMRFVRKLRQTEPAEAFVVIETSPGEECQVDYGEGPMVRNEQTGKYKRTRLFILTLGCSRKSIRLLCWKSSSKIWAQLHETAFQRLGGVPKIVVLDNLREGVITPDVYDPELNLLYSDVLSHYGATAIPCRVRHPNRKGKVESAVGHTQSTALKGKRFETIEEAQAFLDQWDATWADTRIHGTTKRQVAMMFAEEKPALQPLPLEPFRYYEYGHRTVHLDGCIEVCGSYYGCPPGHIGERLLVQWNDTQVRLLEPKTGQLLREHWRTAKGHYKIASEDKPQRTPKTTTQLLERAQRVGAQTAAVCQAIYKTQGELGVRQILGVLGFAKRYGVHIANDACQAALELQMPTYRFVRRYIERHPARQIAIKQIDPLIRDLTVYRDIINQLTKETEHEHQ